MAITKILNINEADDRNPGAHLEHAITYIQNPDKTNEKVLVGSINCLPDTAFSQMMDTKQMFGKMGKRQGYHLVISFPPGEATPEQAMEVTRRFAEEHLGENYEVVYAVHTDKEHCHGHIIWNSVSLTTGYKYDSPKENRIEIYTFSASQVDEVRFDSDGNTLVLDGKVVDSCCLNCANPRCMFINEEAIQNKYGSYCFRIAKNILTVWEDAEECVNDTWNLSWNKIPPIIPLSLKAFLGKLVRDIAISQYRANHAKKRYRGIEVIFDELEECIPSDFDVEENFDNQQLSELINNWLGELPKEDRVLFIKSYYYGDAVKKLAKEIGCTENQMAQRMLKLRKKLKMFLYRKGVKA